MKNKSLSKNYPLWVVLPTGLIYTIFTVTPLLMSAYLSLTDWNIDRLSTPVFKGLVNYQAILLVSAANKNNFIRANNTFTSNSSK
jgi:ABC-type sugar transport system permease subunit